VTTYTIDDVQPGDIMFAKHVSPTWADLLIKGGQIFLGQPAYPHHVAVVVKGGRNGRIVQAMPNGAEEVSLEERYWTKDYEFIRPNYPDRVGMSVGQAVATFARRYVGTPYSFADYAAIAGLRLGIRNGLVRRYVTTSKHMICSQLADQAMADAGFHVFTDGRLPQDVTPGALRARLVELGPALIINPPGGAPLPV
jgi:cell wall-associated NlpC family hydrolase